MKHLLNFLLLLIALNAVGQNTYYFSSSSGYFSNQITPTQAKSQSTPYRSLSTLDSMLQGKLSGVTVTDDDVFLLKGGDEFVGSLTPTIDGTAGHPITIGTYGSSERAVITSLKKITSWTSLGNNKYQSPVLTGTEPRFLFINKKFITIGRWPNDLGSANNYGYIQYDASTSTSVTDNDWSTLTGKPAVELTSGNGDFAFRTNHFRFDVVPIKAATSGNAITFTLPSYTQAIRPGMGYFLENQAAFNDLNTEWSYSRTNKTINLNSNVNPSTLNIEVTTADKLLDITGGNFYQIQNIKFVGSNNYGVSKTAGNDITFNNCEVKYTRSKAMNLSSIKNLKIMNSLVDSSLTAGVVIFNYDADTATIIDTKVKNTMFYAGMGEARMVGYAVVLNGPSFLFKNNEVINSGYTSLNYQYGSNVRIINNLLNGACQILDDGGALYTNNQGYQFDHTNILIQGNIVENTDNGINGRNADVGTFATDGFTMAMYGDQYTTNQVWENNTIIGGRIGIYFNDPTKMVIRNNMIYGYGTSHTGSTAGLQMSNIHIAGQPYYWYHGGPGELMTNSGPAIAGNVVTNNIFFNASTNTTSPLPAVWFTKQSATTTTLEPKGYGTFNNNKFIYPSSPNGGYFKTQTLASGGGWTTKRYTLPNWRTAFTYEINSTISPVIFTTTPAVTHKLLVNRTKGSLPFTLDNKTWKNAATGAPVVNNILYVESYSSVLLLYTGEYIPGGDEINIEPSSAWVTPTDNQEFIVGDSITLLSNATDTDGAIAKVEFYDGGTLMHTENTAPYEWKWGGASLGTHTLTAMAYDDKGATKISSARTILVKTAPIIDPGTGELIKIKAKIKTINDLP